MSIVVTLNYLKTMDKKEKTSRIAGMFGTIIDQIG